MSIFTLQKKKFKPFLPSEAIEILKLHRSHLHIDCDNDSQCLCRVPVCPPKTIYDVRVTA